MSYAALCAVSPFATCRTCDGLGFALHHDRHGKPKRGKDCRRCKATGARIRLGRHWWNLWRRLHHDANR
ncbi:hypothetical protein FHU37_002516 [Allostreptomyces psammosilenae]|uniref:Uncharacterized protein n=1 Tax=Allostreptomyces psammosilenae TaxID=1892865 RepID=A0A852ZT41_9ACTN|nr:hypothetical protein [Allostreptomyces psammosilenae]